jgi:hypothetical protein
MELALREPAFKHLLEGYLLVFKQVERLKLVDLPLAEAHSQQWMPTLRFDSGSC